MMEKCSNTVSFRGEQTAMVLNHFRSFPKTAPPFLNTSVIDDKVKFYSQWTPPIRDLNAIAERFGVSYQLTYRIPGEAKEFFSYVCLDHEPISPVAERIKDVLKGISTEEELRDAEMMVGELFYHRTLDLRDLGVIGCLLKRRSYAVEPSIAPESGHSEKADVKPWEGNERSPSGGLKR